MSKLAYKGLNHIPLTTKLIIELYLNTVSIGLYCPLYSYIVLKIAYR